MDVDAALSEIREITESAGTVDDTADQAAILGRLCELVTSVDEWLSRGGFLPTAWAVGR